MICARRVFRCFKWMEHFTDKLTGAAGPYFVGLAIILISTGTFSFCESSRQSYDADSPKFYWEVSVIQPTLSFPVITTPVCMLIALNLLAHYYYVCTVPPGFIDEAPREPGKSFLWAKKRDTRARKQLTGVQWSDESKLWMTTASITKCKRCNKSRPEVSSALILLH